MLQQQQTMAMLVIALACLSVLPTLSQAQKLSSLLPSRDTSASPVQLSSLAYLSDIKLHTGPYLIEPNSISVSGVSSGAAMVP
jgi:hypothetical protein